MSSVLESPPREVHVLAIEGPLQAPLPIDLLHRLWFVLSQGGRRVVLDLAAVSAIDAAGVGELVRAYNAMTAVNGALCIVRARGPVRELLERVGLFELMHAGESGDSLAAHQGAA